MLEKGSLSVSKLLKIAILLIGLHSALLGGIIYFFTVPFYQFFFSVDPDNFFFVKQSGVFLFLIGLFYFVPAFNMRKNKAVIALVVLSKITAVTFLLKNAHLTPAPPMIYLAAFGDGSMALLLAVLSFLCFKNKVFPFDS